MHIALYNDTINNKNFGCQLVSHSLRKALSDYYPDSTVEYLPMERAVKCKKTPDIIIVNGEGSFGHVSKIVGGYSMLTYILDNYKVPVYLVNTSIQVPQSYIETTEKLLSRCALVTLREPISYEFLKKNTSLTNLKIFPDIGTYLLKDEPEPIKDIDIAFGLGAIVKFIGKESIKIKEFVEIFNELAEQGYTVVAQQFLGNPINDLEALKPYLSHKVMTNDGLFKDYFDTVKRARLNITGRHHGAVMSFMGKTPFFTYESNMWKTEGDQLLYGPFDKFTFKKFDKSKLKENIISNLNKYIDHRQTLDSKYSVIKNTFGGHIEVTKNNKLQGLEIYYEAR